MNQSKALFAALALLSVSLGVPAADAAPRHPLHAHPAHKRSTVPPKRREDMTHNLATTGQKAAEKNDQYIRS